MLQPSAHAKGLVLESSIARDVPERCTATAAHLRQILLNLMSQRGQVHRARHGRAGRAAAVRPTADTVRLRFSVRDTGIGIPRGPARAHLRGVRAGRLRPWPPLRRHRPGHHDRQGADRSCSAAASGSRAGFGAGSQLLGRIAVAALARDNAALPGGRQQRHRLRRSLRAPSRARASAAHPGRRRPVGQPLVMRRLLRRPGIGRRSSTTATTCSMRWRRSSSTW